MGIKIRKTRKKELKDIAKIYSKGFSEPPYNEPWTIKKALKKLRIFFKYCDIWIIAKNKRIIGFFVINPTWFYPGEVIFGDQMVIKKEYRNKGYGKIFMKTVLEFYGKKGFESFMFISDKRSKAYGFFKKLEYGETKNNKLFEVNLTTKNIK